MMARYKGVTLIELMIVVAIVGILAVIAIPSYQASILKGKRSEAIAFSIDVAARQERFFTENGTYARTITGTCETCLNMDTANSAGGLYSVTIDLADGGGAYTATYAPNDFVDNECGSFELTNTGQRTITGNGTVEECWR